MAQLGVNNKSMSTEYSVQTEHRLITLRSDEGDESFDDQLNCPGEFLCEDREPDFCCQSVIAQNQSELFDAGSESVVLLLKNLSPLKLSETLQVIEREENSLDVARFVEDNELSQ